MGRTLTPKQETFCQAMLMAKNASEAYRRAGYGSKARDVSANASRLLAQVHVAARVQELRDQAATPAIMERREALVILTSIARARMGDYLREDGSIDVKKVLDSGPGIGDVQIGATGQPRRTRLKLSGQIKAIDQLARLCGWYRQDAGEGPKVIFNFDVRQPPDQQGTLPSRLDSHESTT